MLPGSPVTPQPPRAYPIRAAMERLGGGDMRRKMLWGLLALVLSAPAVWAGTKMAANANCPVPCPDCPFGR